MAIRNQKVLDRIAEKKVSPSIRQSPISKIKGRQLKVVAWARLWALNAWALRLILRLARKIWRKSLRFPSAFVPVWSEEERRRDKKSGSGFWHSTLLIFSLISMLSECLWSIRRQESKLWPDRIPEMRKFRAEIWDCHGSLGSEVSKASFVFVQEKKAVS